MRLLPTASATAAQMAAVMALAAMPALAQQPSLEYQVKAAYLYNFIKFVEWPAAPRKPALTVCVANANPFDGALDDLIRGESIDRRPLVTRTIQAPQADCDAIFVPRSVSAAEYLRAVRTAPVLTVGESTDFIAQGGIINFVADAGMIRFEIDQDAARRSGLQISSRLLRLARPPARTSQR